MRQHLPSYAQSNEDEAFRRYLQGRPASQAPESAAAVDGALPAYDAARAVPAPPPAAPVQTFDDELAPMAQNPRGQAPEQPAQGRDFGDRLSDFAEAFVGGNPQARRAQEQAHEEDDPASPRSQVLRQRMAPVLKQMGLTDQDISHLSGSDIRQASQGGKLLSGLMTLRTKSAMARQQAAEDAAKAQAAQAEFDRRAELTGNTAQGKMDRAEVMSGMAGDRAENQAYLQNRLALGRDAVNEQQRQAAEQRAHQWQVTHDAQADARKKEQEIRQSEIMQRRQTAKKAADQKLGLVQEEVALDDIEKKLMRRLPDESLPGYGNIVSRGAIEAKKNLLGGSGMDADDTMLKTDLDSLGLITYSHTANNAPNAVPEQEMSKTFFAVDGTVAGALKAIRQRKKRIAETKKKVEALIQAGDARGASHVLSSDPDEAALGGEEVIE